MRRTTPPTLAAILLPMALAGCGFGDFLDHTFSNPLAYPPTLPMTDSLNVRRVLGRQPDPTPLQPEPGNVWPGPERPEPTLSDIAEHPEREDQRGFPPTNTPGATPGLPDSHQPRPQGGGIGSSTPPGNVPGNTAVSPSLPAPGAPPRTPSSVPSAGPQGPVTQTPQGPAVDTGGTNNYRTLNTPQGPGAIMVPNGNGTSTIINPNGSIQTVPTPR